MRAPALPLPVGRQKEVLYLPSAGHLVVLGTAGSGKTTLAILRSAYLGDPNTDNNGRTLLVTYNRALVSYLRHFQGPSFKNVVVENFHRFARGYLSSRGRMGYNSICEEKLRESLIIKAVVAIARRGGTNSIFERGSDFFSAEIAWIEQHAVTTADDYSRVQRIGRAEAPLERRARNIVFEVYEEYLRLRTTAGKDFDWDDIANGVCEEFDKDNSRRFYRHVVIDEGQDFSPQMIRSLAMAIPPEGSLSFFGDMAQQIYGRRMSWKSAGLNVQKVWEFRENYRNTKQIAALGLAISRMPYYEGTPDLVEPVSPKADGPLPALVEFGSAEKEIQFALDLATQIGKTQTVAILGRTWDLVRTIANRLPRSAVKLDRDLSTWQAGPKIYYGSFHGAKGLEFDTVILPFFTSSNLPDAELVKAVGKDEADATDGKLIYVGATRAKTRLVITFSGKVTELLPSRDGLYQSSKQ
jgi:superfamily I DNA/RNA helicase